MHFKGLQSSFFSFLYELHLFYADQEKFYPGKDFSLMMLIIKKRKNLIKKKKYLIPCI